MQQKVLWAELLKEMGRRKGRWKIQDLLADQRCSQTVLDYLTSTDVGRTVPAVEEEADAGSEVSEWELRERLEREDERRVEVEALGGGEELLFLPTPSFMASAGED